MENDLQQSTTVRVFTKLLVDAMEGKIQNLNVEDSLESRTVQSIGSPYPQTYLTGRKFTVITFTHLSDHRNPEVDILREENKILRKQILELQERWDNLKNTIEPKDDVEAPDEMDMNYWDERLQ